MIALLYVCLFSVLAYATTKHLLKRYYSESLNFGLSLGSAVLYASYQSYNIINDALAESTGNENIECCGLMDGGIAMIFVFGFMSWVCFALCFFLNRLVDRFD
jgi:hypothetical protein